MVEWRYSNSRGKGIRGWEIKGDVLMVSTIILSMTPLSKMLDI
jgi:hypothetical protein